MCIFVVVDEKNNLGPFSVHINVLFAISWCRFLVYAM